MPPAHSLQTCNSLASCMLFPVFCHTFMNSQHNTEYRIENGGEITSAKVKLKEIKVLRERVFSRTS
jgi:hypothetical protein